MINDHLYVVQLTPEIEKVFNISKLKPYKQNKYSKTVRSNQEPTVVNPPTVQVNEHSSSEESSEDEELVVRKRKRPMSPPQPHGSTPARSTSREDNDEAAQSSIAEPEATVGGYSTPTDRTRSSTSIEASEPSSESPAELPRLRPRESLRAPSFYQGGQ